MKQEITKGLGDGAITLAVSSGVGTNLGWFEFINTNAPGLGFIASCAFGLIGTMFYYLTYLKRTKNSKKIEQMQAELDRINDRKSK